MADDARHEPLLNMRFRVEIGAMQRDAAVEVILPEARITRGRSKGITTEYGPLILKRVLTRSSDWYAWWDSARRSGSVKKRAQPHGLMRTVRVTLIDGGGRDAQRWEISAAPVAYQVSSLNALGNQPLIECLELNVRDFRARFE